MAAARVPSDPCVVSAAPLSTVVQGFIDRWERDRPRRRLRSTTSSTLSADVGFYGAVQWLSQETGLNERLIRKIANGERRYAEERTAELIASALGHPEWLHDGTLPFEPRNPRAPETVRARCCGGSLSLTG